MTTQTKQPTKPAPLITLNPVKSSNIAATGYDSASKTMAVQFRAGAKIYHYAGVPEAVFTDMRGAESIGKYIGTQIVGKYKHTLQIAQED